jgi:hypothetical protein
MRSRAQPPSAVATSFCETAPATKSSPPQSLSRQVGRRRLISPPISLLHDYPTAGHAVRNGNCLGVVACRAIDFHGLN